MNPKFCLVFLLLAAASVSEAHPRCINCRYGRDLTARFDTRYCRDIKGTFKWTCDHVEFDPAEVALK